ncbi:Protein ADM-4 [Aphelenchoides avenae]|nr:Protein ADM-4 [Aphelenchus avenae]
MDYYPQNVMGFSVPKESVLERYLPRKRNAEPIKKTRCELKVVADYDFYHIIGNDNYANAARYLVNLIQRVNSIFTRVDWGLDMNNRRLLHLGFAIKEIKIFDKPTLSPTHHFNTGPGQHANAFEMLKSFSVDEGTPNVCLSVLISGKIFDQGILGVANIGYPGERGICAKQPFNGSMYLNTAVMSVQRRTGLMITRVVDLVVAHELGHSWGAFHDDSEDPECVPPGSQDGRYIMHESSNSGYDRNNYRFSPCSVRLIHRVLYGLAEHCFAEEQAALCGNGILEDGEECDSDGVDCVEEGQCRAGQCVPFCQLLSTDWTPCICENEPF